MATSVVANFGLVSESDLEIKPLITCETKLFVWRIKLPNMTDFLRTTFESKKMINCTGPKSRHRQKYFVN
ncbi:hypothetical protein L596_026014 [Steinernema carpocapsae]|uniref:Uncharacterized protein n=1 Tax=Steinernema carpocapsae TaxID=34508 RepID=A0A4U5M032_STECR|nr:hypothetical protein L596_026014 [Steinernema carpocapsae]